MIKYEGIDEELIELDEEDDELELLLVDVGIELEALLEDKEGLGPTSPHAANTSTEVFRKDHFTEF